MLHGFKLSYYFAVCQAEARNGGYPFCGALKVLGSQIGLGCWQSGVPAYYAMGFVVRTPSIQETCKLLGCTQKLFCRVRNIPTEGKRWSFIYLHFLVVLNDIITKQLMLQYAKHWSWKPRNIFANCCDASLALDGLRLRFFYRRKPATLILKPFSCMFRQAHLYVTSWKERWDSVLPKAGTLQSGFLLSWWWNWRRSEMSKQ